MILAIMIMNGIRTPPPYKNVMKTITPSSFRSIKSRIVIATKHSDNSKNVSNDDTISSSKHNKNIILDSNNNTVS